MAYTVVIDTRLNDETWCKYSIVSDDNAKETLGVERLSTLFRVQRGGKTDVTMRSCSVECLYDVSDIGGEVSYDEFADLLNELLKDTVVTNANERFTVMELLTLRGEEE